MGTLFSLHSHQSRARNHLWFLLLGLLCLSPLISPVLKLRPSLTSTPSKSPEISLTSGRDARQVVPGEGATRAPASSKEAVPSPRKQHLHELALTAADLWMRWPRPLQSFSSQRDSAPSESLFLLLSEAYDISVTPLQNGTLRLVLAAKPDIWTRHFSTWDQREHDLQAEGSPGSDSEVIAATSDGHLQVTSLFDSALPSAYSHGSSDPSQASGWTEQYARFTELMSSTWRDTVATLALLKAKGWLERLCPLATERASLLLSRSPLPPGFSYHVSASELCEDLQVEVLFRSRNQNVDYFLSDKGPALRFTSNENEPRGSLYGEKYPAPERENNTFSSGL